MKRLFITGTDTGVGKTTVACALAAAFRLDGRRIATMHILPPHTVIDKGVDDLIIQVGDSTSAAGHPLVEVSEKC